jgi:hypothetical protein
MTDMDETRRRAWILIIEIVGVDIIGPMSVLWCWNFERAKARLRKWKILARCMLWLLVSG